jgi:hypothetical protein
MQESKNPEKKKKKKKPFNDSTPNSLHANPYSQQEKEPASLETRPQTKHSEKKNKKKNLNPRTNQMRTG